MEEPIKTIEFGEDQLKDLESLAQALFYDDKDPRSPTYARKLYRPKVSWLRILAYIFLPPLALVGLSFWGCALGLPVHGCVVLSILLWGAFLTLTATKAVLCAIKLYQRYAPDSVRNQCRFEPSCSVYMYRAIEMYGLWQGVSRGRKRLKRCNVNDGGYDEP